jgi:signal transduction histidine kinase
MKHETSQNPLPPAERAPQSHTGRQLTLLATTPAVAELLHAMPTMVLILNSACQIVSANAPVLEHFHLSDLTNIVGQRPGELLNCTYAAGRCDYRSTLCAQQSCGVMRALWRANQGQANVEDCHLLRADGKALDLQVRVAPFNCNGESFLILSLLNIDHGKQREMLAHALFHDIANTVSIIRSAVELFPTEKDAEMAEKLQRMSLTAIRWLVHDIDMLETLLTAENGELQPRYEVIEVRAFLQELADMYATHKAANGKSIHIAPTTETIIVESDPHLLARIVGNLLKNALEASQSGETVTLSGACVDGMIQFQVHNAAVIPTGIQARMFHRAFSTKGAGRGLGTYSAKLLTEQYLHGTVDFQSREDTGTVFTMRFPLSPRS